jgi:hypothetical protein
MSSKNSNKKNMIYNPMNNKMVKRDTDLGEKLAEFKEQGIILYSIKDSLIKYMKEINPEITDKEYASVYLNLPEETKFMLDGIIPSQWKDGIKFDFDKKPKKITPSKLYSEYRKPILMQELEEDETGDISGIIKSEWKYSKKSRKNKTIHQKFTNLAKIENKYYPDRIANYIKKHKDDLPKELSKGDKKKMEDKPGDYELNEGTLRLNKIKKEKEQKKKPSRKHNVNDDNESDELEEEDSEKSEQELEEEDSEKSEQESEEDYVNSDSVESSSDSE